MKVITKHELDIHKISLVGSGSPHHIPPFKKITGFTGRVLTDRTRKSFELLGLTSSIGGLLGKKTVSRIFSALRGGIQPGSLQGSAFQLGGAAVVDRNGKLLYLYQSKEAADDPPILELYAKLKAKIQG